MQKWPYLLVWSFLVAVTAGHRVTESLESDEAQNTTTLYPVPEAAPRNSSEEHKEKKSNSNESTSWKIEAAFAESKLPEDFKDNQTKERDEKNCSKEFRPSPPLGIIGDSEESLRTRAQDNFIPMKKPASGFLGSPNRPFKSSFYSPPKEVFRQNDFPYKIESSIFTKAKGGWSSIESKPTVESPVRVPAGGLYNSPDAFKDKPGLDGGDDNFGLEFNRGVKDGPADVKKR
ncbi:uncharacterized protein LOC132902588 [Amyelois transitella]|uniref:uncharacterized protein LOC132902588 n=1 Tax=Amyelois transitella TaxID=680683 RepID=UPI0029906A2D|nr:uncharacterized protein LOC132902588 [Amyelois transitella]